MHRASSLPIQRLVPKVTLYMWQKRHRIDYKEGHLRAWFGAKSTFPLPGWQECSGKCRQIGVDLGRIILRSLLDIACTDQAFQILQAILPALACYLGGTIIEKLMHKKLKVPASTGMSHKLSFNCTSCFRFIRFGFWICLNMPISTYAK